MTIHKSNKNRITACGIPYPTPYPLSDIIHTGYWKRVTCIRCLKTRKVAK